MQMRGVDVKMRLVVFRIPRKGYPAARSAHFRHIEQRKRVTIGNQSTIDIVLLFGAVVVAGLWWKKKMRF